MTGSTRNGMSSQAGAGCFATISILVNLAVILKANMTTGWWIFWFFNLVLCGIFVAFVIEDKKINQCDNCWRKIAMEKQIKEERLKHETKESSTK